MAKKSLRKQALRNALVLAINAGLEQRVFGLGEEENFFGEATTYRFEADGIPAVAHVIDAGWGELAVDVALWPVDKNLGHLGGYDMWAHVRHAQRPGDMVASCWFERKTGKYIMDGDNVGGSTSALSAVAALSVEPHGFKDHGKFII